jgi:preprotein translocase subunit SecA
MLSVIDEKWKDHLYDLDQLRAAIQYRAWGQKDPLVEYKGEAYEMFVGLMHDLRTTFTERWLKLQIEVGPPGGPGGPPRGGGPTATGPAGGRPPRRPGASDLVSGAPRRSVPMVASKPAAQGLVGAGVGGEGGGGGGGGGGAEATGAVGAAVSARNPYAGVGRNDPCPCGSGKKFKKCHGAAM